MVDGKKQERKSETDPRSRVDLNTAHWGRGSHPRVWQVERTRSIDAIMKAAAWTGLTRRAARKSLSRVREK